MDCMQAMHNLVFFVCWITLVLFISLAHSTAQVPVADWQFGEGSGTVAYDSSGNGYTATLADGVGWITEPNGIAADSNLQQFMSALPVDLSDTNAITVSLWVNRQYSMRGAAVLFEAPQDYTRSATGFALYADSRVCQGMQASLQGNAGYTTNCYSQPPSGTWHNLIVVFDKSQIDGNEIVLYVDGNRATPTGTLAVSTNTNNFGQDPFYMLSRGGMSNFASAEVADVRIYNTALTAQQIENLFTLSSSIGLSPSFDITASPFAFTVKRGSSVVSGITSTIANGFDSEVSLSVSGVPDGMTVTFTPNPIPGPGAGISTVTISVGSMTGAGTYPLGVLGTSGSMQRVSTISVAVTDSPVVDLTWVGSQNVIGYNAYRSDNSGGPYAKINSELIPGTSYTDNNVQSGSTYYYVATSVDSEYRESGYSNEALANVPSEDSPATSATRTGNTAAGKSWADQPAGSQRKLVGGPLVRQY